MSNILVKNKNGTSSLSCSCGTWQKHWQRGFGSASPFCSEVTCMTMTDLVGAHVIKVNSTDKDTYIIQLCKAHNSTTNEMTVPLSKLVRANKAETCER